MQVKEKKGGQFFELYKGDCLIENDKIESGSVDLILTDLPYGIMTTLNYFDQIKSRGVDSFKWDLTIDVRLFMDVAERILRQNGKMILTALDPFSTELKIKQNPNLQYCYPMIWDKCNYGHALLANKAPLNFYEDILIFSKKEDSRRMHPLRKYLNDEYKKTGLTHKEINRDYLGTTFEGGGGLSYNMLSGKGMCFRMPTLEIYTKLQNTGCFKKPYKELKIEDEAFKNKMKSTFNLWEGNKYKSNILKYKKDYNGYHPTQKPILLLEDLIKTFSNENDLVVDLTMGSGSTGVAALNTKRNFIGIEKDDKYFDIAVSRIKGTEPNPQLADKPKAGGLFSFTDDTQKAD